MSTLEGPRAAAMSGETSSLVILLHGYGADGGDLFGLAQPLSDYMPNTVFRAPNAPERCTMNPAGFQWFPIPWLDGSTEAQQKEGFERSVGLLNAYLDGAMAEEGVTAAGTALIGFSQGTMMSLYVAPRRPEPVAGIVGFSGRLMPGETFGPETVSKPPVLLVHGDMDDMIDVSEMSKSETALRGAGFEVASHVSRGIGHGIAPDGLGLAVKFLTERLGIPMPV